MTKNEFQGQKPTKDQREAIDTLASYWLKVSFEATIQGLERVEDAAKQLIAINSALQGLYFALYTFSDLKKQITAWQILFFLTPMILWLISIYCASQVFVPRIQFGTDLEDLSQNAWLKIRDVYIGTLTKKLKWLHRSHIVLALSFIAIIFILIFLSFLPIASPDNPTKIIIMTPSP
jgi:hypothetical protein